MTRSLSTHRGASAASLALVLTLTACGTEEGGDVSVLLQAEDTITEGLEPGDGAGRIVDGWHVEFDRYLVALGHVQLGEDRDHLDDEVALDLVYDLTRMPQGGLVVSSLRSDESGRRPYFGYEVISAEGALAADGVAEEDVSEMATAGAAYLLTGALTKADGESCPPGGTCRPAPRVEFRLLASAATAFGPCELDGLPGVSVPAGGDATVGVTLHGDHAFFNAFPLGSEVVERRAQWLADADLDGDGVVLSDELDAIRGADLGVLFPSEHYDLGGWTAFPIDSALDFLRAQLSTQGHYQGEGECVWTVGGVSGGHDHDDDHDH